MPIKKNLLEYFDDNINNKIIDMKNPNCINCNECCDMFAIISEKELKYYKKYFKNAGKSTFEIALNNFRNMNNKEKTISFMCPFITNTKRCMIYSKRPQICREFHCTESLNKLKKEEKIENTYYTIYDLFKNYSK